MIKLSRKQLWALGILAVGMIILLTILAAPANNKLTSGSTYNRSPDGYGAWYAFMSKKETTIKRWQKPLADLVENKTIQSPVTLLRVHSSLTHEYSLLPEEQKWVEKGNILVNLGIRQLPTAAEFSTIHQSTVGNVKIDTTRRHKDVKEQILGDRFGAIVWEKSFGKGKVIYATTPYLAANAYQDFPGNYEFLAQIVTQSLGEENNKNITNISYVSPVLRTDFGNNSNQQSITLSQNPLVQKSKVNTVLVDEYIHGYKDTDVIEREVGEDVLSYFIKTPVFPAFIQSIIILLVAIWAGNRRFGQPETLSTSVVDNSEAYIQALAAVLQKANSSDFILEVVGKEEQLQLQKALSLGQVPLDERSLIDAWVQQTKLPAAELQQLLRQQSQKGRISETNLLAWLEKWRQIRSHLPFNKTNN